MPLPLPSSPEFWTASRFNTRRWRRLRSAAHTHTHTHKRDSSAEQTSGGGSSGCSSRRKRQPRWRPASGHPFRDDDGRSRRTERGKKNPMTLKRARDRCKNATPLPPSPRRRQRWRYVLSFSHGRNRDSKRRAQWILRFGDTGLSADRPKRHYPFAARGVFRPPSGSPLLTPRICSPRYEATRPRQPPSSPPFVFAATTSKTVGRRPFYTRARLPASHIRPVYRRTYLGHLHTSARVYNKTGKKIKIITIHCPCHASFLRQWIPPFRFRKRTRSSLRCLRRMREKRKAIIRIIEKKNKPYLSATWSTRVTILVSSKIRRVQSHRRRMTTTTTTTTITVTTTTTAATTTIRQRYAAPHSRH